MSTREQVNSFKKDKMEGMDKVVEDLRARGEDLRTIIWVKEDEEGNQWFEIQYTSRLQKAKSLLYDA